MSRDLLDTKYDRFFQAGFLFGAIAMALLLASIWPSPAQAATFPLWQSVTVQTMTDPVPEFRYEGTPGAVTPKQWVKPVPVDGCPILENGVVVGLSLNCFPSAERGGIRARL